MSSFPIAEPDPDTECGRGLLLVDALAHRWGRFVSGRGPGMFFELHWDTEPPAPVVPARATGAGGVSAMADYSLWPSETVRQLRADFPDYLIFQSHDQLGRPRIIATRTPPNAPGAADLVITPDAEAMRDKLARQPTSTPTRTRGGGRS